MFRVDFTNQEELNTFFIENKKRWRVCVFLVGERNIDLCEKDWNATLRINVDAADHMSALCAKEGIYFIHLSTDYVFDGTSQPCFSNSPVNPIQNYGISKLMSEYRVQKNYIHQVTLASCLTSIGISAPNYCIIRSPLLYTSNTRSSLYDNSVTALAKNVMDLRHVTSPASGASSVIKYIDDYYIQRPVYVTDLCIFIRVIVMIAIDNLSNICSIKSSSGTKPPKFSGVYHFYNPDNRFTQYQITKMIAEYMNLSHQHVIPLGCEHQQHRRLPYDPQLFDARFNIRNYFTHTFEETIPYIFSRYKHSKIGTNTTSDDTSSYFLMFDLDGTLVHTSYAHYRSYLDVFRARGLSFMSYSQWNAYINTKNIHTFLEEVASELAGHDIVQTERILSDIRNEKLEAFKTFAPLYVTPTKNSVELLRWIERNPDIINAVIVTNCTHETAEIIRSVVPELNKITKWCVRDPTYVPESLSLSKSNPKTDCYTKAKNMYYNNETYIIGFENTLVGYQSLRKTTPIVYLYVDENDTQTSNSSNSSCSGNVITNDEDKWYNTTDAFIFDDYRSVFDANARV
jgi:dTDP-4-dehydrorhamnose reductase/beta-phosphoglucomutase-like phosphatase (HAD superfamily)